jgi:hypothetical protein
MHGGMERAGELSEHGVVFPPPPLVARVVVGRAPDMPLASLDDFVGPVVDDAGRIVDWMVRRDGAYGASELKAYHEWRAAWERAWELGPLSNVRSLQRVVALMDGVSHLAALLAALVAEPEAQHIEPSGVADLLTELETVRTTIVAEDREGMAIVDQTPRRRPIVGFSRTWTTPSEPELLAANTATGVVVDPAEGLVVIDQATGLRRLTDVVEADLRAEVVVVTNRLGETIELEAAAARPLAWIVPASVRWRVRPIPEIVVWSALFSRLPDALRVGVTMGATLSFTVDRDS